MEKKSQIIKLNVSFMSIIGRTRIHNEDSLFANGYYLNQRDIITVSENRFYEEKFHLFGVFDGMGGASLGDLASSIASRGHEYVYHFLQQDDLKDSVLKVYNSYVEVINQRILKEKKKNSVKQMGTTLATLIFRNGKVYPFFLGDTRIYCCREGRMKQLSVDHTEVAMLVRLGILNEEQISSHSSSGKLRQFLGFSEGGSLIETDYHPEFEYKIGDSYLICSDGLSGYLNKSLIESELKSGECANLILDRLINKALENNSNDNITGIVIKVL